MHPRRLSGLETRLPIFKSHAVTGSDGDPFRSYQKHVWCRFGSARILRTDHGVKPLQNVNHSQRSFRRCLGTAGSHRHRKLEDEFEPLRQRFLRDVAQRRFQNLRLTNAHYQEAVGLFRAHFTKRFRACDSIHLSVALDLNRRGVLDHFVSADESLCSVAMDEGLSTLNPLES
jgi:hypothetical protein